MFIGVADSGRTEATPVPGHSAAPGVCAGQSKFLRAYVLAIAVFRQRPRTLCCASLRYKNAISVTACRKAERFEACFSSPGRKSKATNSCLTFGQAGTSGISLSVCMRTGETKVTEMLEDSSSSFVKTSVLKVPCLFTKPERRSWRGLRGYGPATPRQVAQARPIRLFQSPPRKPRNNARLAAWPTLVALCCPALASAAPLPLATFAQLAASCAPHVAVETLAAVARTESGFDALVLHDNTTGRTYHPATREDAIASGVELATVGHHSVDVGLMQINSANLVRMGLTLADAFDPCRNLSAADRVLVDGYTAPASGQDPQPAVQQALSRYNTGDASRGVSNGYVARVQASAELVVPALRLRSEATSDQPGPLGAGAPVTAQPLPHPPASWDVYGQAKASRGQGAVVFGVSPLPAPVPAAVAPSAPVHAPATPLPGEPVPLRRLPNVEAMNNAR